MTQNWLQFEDFLRESFCDGQCSRELRLSADQFSYLSRHYPLFSCAAAGQAQSDGTCWYRVSCFCSTAPLV